MLTKIWNDVATSRRAKARCKYLFAEQWALWMRQLRHGSVKNKCIWCSCFAALHLFQEIKLQIRISHHCSLYFSLPRYFLYTNLADWRCHDNWYQFHNRRHVKHLAIACLWNWSWRNKANHLIYSWFRVVFLNCGAMCQVLKSQQLGDLSEICRVRISK